MSSISRIAFAVVCTLGLGSCAYTTAQKVDPNNPATDGFIYYECKPIIVVAGNSVDVKYIPNPSRAYSVQFGAFLAKNHTKLTFGSDCGLTTVDGNLDTTEIIKLFQDVLDKIAPDAAGATGPVQGTSPDPVQIYEIIFDKDGNIVALRPLIKGV